MSEERKKSVWPWIAAALITLPVLYVASFGPACWITSRMNANTGLLPRLYRPIVQRMSPNGAFSPDGSGRLDRVIRGYASWGALAGWNFFCDICEDGSRLDWEWKRSPNNHWTDNMW